MVVGGEADNDGRVGGLGGKYAGCRGAVRLDSDQEREEEMGAPV